VHIEKVKYWDSQARIFKECEVPTFDTMVHLTKGKRHILRDISRLLKEEERNKIGLQDIAK